MRKNFADAASIGDETAESFSSSIIKTQFARLRTMPRLHERDSPNDWARAVHPIIASPQPFTHGMFKWVNHLLRPCLTRCPTILKYSDNVFIYL